MMVHNGRQQLLEEKDCNRIVKNITNHFLRRIEMMRSSLLAWITALAHLVTLCSSSVVQLSPSQDTMVRGGVYADTNFGTIPDMA